MAKDQIKITLDFMKGSLLMKCMDYYVKNFEKANKELFEEQETNFKDQATEKEIKHAIGAFAVLTAASLDEVRAQILRKGHEKGWGSDEHKEKWTPKIPDSLRD